MARKQKTKRVKRGGANPYRKGADFEREVAEWFRKAGCLVTRQPKSQSPYDLIAIKPIPQFGERSHYVALVQCKLAGRMDRKEKEELIALAERYNAVPILAYKKEGALLIETL